MPKTTINEHFSRQADAYAISETHAHGDDLDIVEELADPQPSDLCLDIACGAGHTAFRLAPKAMFVVGVDLAGGMVRKATLLAQEKELKNTLFQLADAHDLPFADGVFDLITCRIAPHHFHDVGKAMSEVQRVMANRGRFVLEDSLSPQEPKEVADFLHLIEVQRDPTHVKSLTLGEWESTLRQAGLRIIKKEIYRKSRSFEKWMQRAGLAGEQIIDLRNTILESPAYIRDQFFEMHGTEITNFQDEKLICRAEKA